MAQFLLPFLHFLLLFMHHPLRILQPLLHVFRAQILLYFFRDGRSHAGDFSSGAVDCLLCLCRKNGNIKTVFQQAPRILLRGKSQSQILLFLLAHHGHGRRGARR